MFIRFLTENFLRARVDFLQNSLIRLLRFARNDRHCEEERRSNLSFARSLVKTFQKYLFLLACGFIVDNHDLRASESVYSFGVLPVRSAVLTAETWNPILEYISLKTGKKLLLKTERTGGNSKDELIKGTYDFAYTNHILEPSVKKSGYFVIARPNSAGITCKIIVEQNSSIGSIEELNNLKVGFASQAAFVGYIVPMNYLEQKKLHIQQIFGGNQEGVMAQLKSAQVKAAAVNSVVLNSYAKRVNFSYDTLWESENFKDFPLSAHPRVSKEDVKAIGEAFINMSKDLEGAKILKQSATIASELMNGFVNADERDYNNYKKYYSDEKN
ncbi:MAG: phosphate/phosphite/phosphonate ABC transporter substrate-binding protein [Campylobacterales bacterium]|nr:phosphate/phosphite/phosphonate ABC transporter substrate-binding protein [Campylobacterales bacterium]